VLFHRQNAWQTRQCDRAVIGMIPKISRNNYLKTKQQALVVTFLPSEMSEENHEEK